jgi:hypothetical protein
MEMEALFHHKSDLCCAISIVTLLHCDLFVTPSVVPLSSTSCAVTINISITVALPTKAFDHAFRRIFA